MLSVITLLTTLTGTAVPGACPPEHLLTNESICYEAGSFDTPANIASATYTPTTAFAAGSELCVKVELTAELEPGGYDRVYLRWDDGSNAESTCVVGDSPGDCETVTGGGCATLPASSWDISDTFCWQPTPGATSVSVGVYVQPFDLLYNCGDCPPGGSPGVTVHDLSVTGCTGVSPSGCGDGVLDSGEGCDDGNTLAQDGCDEQCQVEEGAICVDGLTSCTGANSCQSLTPDDISASYCYTTGDTQASSPLTWTWRLGANPGPMDLHWDVEGGVELNEPEFDALYLSWQDDAGNGADILLNDGDEIAVTKTQMWSKGSVRIQPGAGATTVTATIHVTNDSATSCQEPKVDQTYEPLTVNALHLTSCDVTAQVFDTLAEFNEAVGLCYLVHDFNELADGAVGPFSGDGYSIDNNMVQDVALTASGPIHFYDKVWGTGFGYLSTQASGDGTIGLEPQAQGNFVSNSRLEIDFQPKPAKAVALNIIDAGDWGGVMAIEAWDGDDLVYVNNDPGASGAFGANNYIVWKGFVFDRPVDRVVLFMVDPSDHFAIDNVIVEPQTDTDGDGIPDQCDCAPSNVDVAGSFPEVCDDSIDNDCDGLTDADDPDCGGGGTSACASYADISFVNDNGNWLTSGDQSWGWSDDDDAWVATGAADLDAVLETAALTIPESACPSFVATLDLGGATEAPNDSVTVSYRLGGGTWVDLQTLSGALSTQSWPLPAQPGDTVSFRLRYTTDGSGLAGEDPRIFGLRIDSDSGDSDNDDVCDACDCAPNNASYGFDCDADDDGYCADDTGVLNPAVATCTEAGGDPTGGGTDCDDAAASANPGNSIEETSQCSDGLDNDCDGLTDTEDVEDCPVSDCTDLDGDGYGDGTTCLGADCDDTSAACTSDCTDVDNDNTPDCADTCLDVDGDNYGVGDACLGADCNDAFAECTTDCTTDADGNAVPDCEQGDFCADNDGDGYGVGTTCAGEDCDDTSATCTTDCTDADNNGTPDCAESCEDADGDDYGDGPGCLGADCDDTNAFCTDDCTDADGNGTPDCAEACEDGDGDGYGVGPGCTGDDCDDAVAACTTDCSDADGNGTPDCAEPPEEDCVDLDADGFGTGADCEYVDCDDTSPLCTDDCTDVDEDGIPDCRDDEIVDPGVGTDVPSETEGCECKGSSSRVPYEAAFVVLFLWGWRRRRMAL